MNKSQMAMLSVKSAIERTIGAYIASYAPTSDYKGFYAEIERYVASLFVSRQITNEYTVRSAPNGNIEVNFVTDGQHSTVHYLLPSALRWKQTNVVPPTPLKVVSKPIKTSEQQLNELIPTLEAAVNRAAEQENTSIVRERLKQEIYSILLKAHAVIAETWVTCDDTNNTQQMRDEGFIRVDIDTTFTDSDDVVQADITAQSKKSLAYHRRTSLDIAHVLSLVYGVLHTIPNGRTEFDYYNILQEELHKKLNDVEDWSITAQDTKPVEQPDALRFTFGVKLNEDADWVSYPIYYKLNK